MAHTLTENNIQLSIHWNSNRNFLADAQVLVDSLLSSGSMDFDQACAFVGAFQRDAFSDGENEEAFNNCGPDA